MSLKNHEGRRETGCEGQWVRQWEAMGSHYPVSSYPPCILPAPPPSFSNCSAPVIACGTAVQPQLSQRPNSSPLRSRWGPVHSFSRQSETDRLLSWTPWKGSSCVWSELVPWSDLAARTMKMETPCQLNSLTCEALEKRALSLLSLVLRICFYYVNCMCKSTHIAVLDALTLALQELWTTWRGAGNHTSRPL